MTRIIGLSGHKRSGKDTAAGHLVAEHGFTRLSFAQSIYDMLYAMDPVAYAHNGIVAAKVWRVQDVVDDLGWETAKDQFPEIRNLLQRLGTEAGRGVLGENVWVDAAMRRAGSIDGPVVFSDVRFPNEADAIRSAGGEVWRIIRPGHDSANDPHPSEHALDDYEFDKRLHNNDTISSLYYITDLALKG